LVAKVNGKAAKISQPVKNGDFLEISWNEACIENLIPENISLKILNEDARTIVINKRQGMVVHPGAGNRSGTLANALLYRMLKRDCAPPGALGIRPGIVHRLDKDTSGVMIAAYDEEAHAFLSAQFKSRSAKKKYIAIVKGIPPQAKARIETCIARDPRDRKRFAVAARGKAAITSYSVLKTWRSHSLLLLRPKTGRTHQLRVHLRHIGCPILGDPIYGRKDTLFPDATLMLHARSLAIALPSEPGEPSEFKAPAPRRFAEIIRRLDAEL
ncbi:MAG: RluA family pseudouridine synthase, partial [Treponema sp.]|nr:RluA family pseudouridine synthase [Treponema sp.]